MPSLIIIDAKDGFMTLLPAVLWGLFGSIVNSTPGGITRTTTFQILSYLI